MRRASSYLAAALVAAAPALALAQGSGTTILPQPKDPNTRVATRGANFLEIGVGARAQALGGAYTASARDVTAMYWNPAGIAHITGVSANISITDLYPGTGIKHTFAGAVLPLGSSGAIGVSFIQLTSGTIERTTEAYPEGGDPAFGSAFEWKATAAGVYYGRRLTDRLDFGAGFKAINEGIANASATYMALDLGTQFQTGLYGTTIGASLTNVGTSGRFQGPVIERFVNNDANFRPGVTHIEYRTNSTPLPTGFRFGVRTELTGSPEAILSAAPGHRLVLLGEIFDAIDTDVNWTLGAEYSFKNMLYFRAGKRWVNEARTDFRSGNFGLSYGGGLSLPLGSGRRFGFDYAYTNMGELKNVQVYSFVLGF